MLDEAFRDKVLAWDGHDTAGPAAVALKETVYYRRHAQRIRQTIFGPINRPSPSAKRLLELLANPARRMAIDEEKYLIEMGLLRSMRGEDPRSLVYAARIYRLIAPDLAEEGKQA